MCVDLPPASTARSPHCCAASAGRPAREEKVVPRGRPSRDRRLARAAARATLALLGAAPAFMLVAVRERNTLWILWTMISLWTALDARNVAASAFSLRRRRAVRGIVGLAALNLALSLCLVFLPIAPLALAKLR